MCILEKSNLKKILNLKPLLKNLSPLCETGKSWGGFAVLQIFQLLCLDVLRGEPPLAKEKGCTALVVIKIKKN